MPSTYATPPSSLIFFDFDRSEITPEGMTVIRQAIDNTRRGGVSRIVIVGNTDRAGTDAYNQKLSQRRADAVRAYLVSHGVAASRLVSKGYGFHQPLVDNATAANRELNRRVQFIRTESTQSPSGSTPP